MGTFHQIAVGVVCVAGAFLFGHFLNNQTPPANPDPLARASSPAVGESKLMLPKANEQSSTLPQFRTKSSLDFEFEQDLPPPSELGSKESNLARRNENRNSADNGLEIEVPDFSALAAQFKGTALELPSSITETSSTVPSQRETGQRLSIGSGSIGSGSIGSGIELPSKTVQPEFAAQPNSNRLRDLREQSSRFEAQPKTMPIDLPNEVAQAPLNHDSLTPDKIEQTFAADAFSPKLKGDASDHQPVRRFEGVAETSGHQPSLGSSILESTQSNRSPNSIISYNDPFPEPETSSAQAKAFDRSGVAELRPTAETDSRIQNTQPAGGWTDRNRRGTPTEASFDRPAEQSNAATGANKIPFGLNEENKVRLARLNRSESKNELPTTNFQEYRTEAGDTLNKLSIKFYGKPDFYLDIYLANRDQLRNPADVPAGIILKIPVYE